MSFADILHWTPYGGPTNDLPRRARRDDDVASQRVAGTAGDIRDTGSELIEHALDGHRTMAKADIRKKEHKSISNPQS